MSTLEEWRRIALASLGLPDKRLLDVLKLVEQAPDRGRVRVVLDQIRPRLVRLRPPRPMTAQRLLFRPVEDLFDPADRYRAKIGRLSRTIVQPCWIIVHNRIEQTLLQSIDDRLRATDPFNHRDIFATGLPLWQDAAQHLTSFLAADTSIGRHRIGAENVTITEDVRQQLLDIADILAIAPEIETVKLHLSERPILGFSPIELELVSTTIARLAADSIRKVKTFVLVLLARMARPGDLLQVLTDLPLPCSSADHADLCKAVGANALTALTHQAQELRQHQSIATDPVAASQTAEQLVARLTSLERSMGGQRDHAGAQQAQVVRREIATFVLDNVVVKANQELFQNLSSPPGSGGGSAAAVPTLEQMENAEKAALSLRRCARVADAVGIRKDVERKLATICTELERHSPPPDADEPTQTESLMRLVRLIELIAGPDEAQRILTARLGRL